MTRKAQAPGLGPLDDPLTAWPNDDLLLKQESRNRIARDHPDLLKVLDWPDLRAAFEEHDAPANEAHRNRDVPGRIDRRFAAFRQSTGQLRGALKHGLRRGGRRAGPGAAHRG